MRTIARWGLVAAAAMLFVSGARASVRVVDVDGTSYSVDVVEAPGATSDDSTALSLTLTNAAGTQTSLIAPTQDPEADRDPFLMLVPGSPGPVLLWSRRNGLYDQIAYSKFQNQQWSTVEYLTSSPRHHIRPQAGVDAFGTGYLVWTELGASGVARLATFDPVNGNPISSGSDLFKELVRQGPGERISATRPPVPQPGSHGKNRVDPGGITPDGGNDGPAVPPSPNPTPTSASLAASPGCSNAVAAVAKNRSLWIGVMHHGSVQRYYRSIIPEGASEDYLTLLLESLLQQNCN